MSARRTFSAVLIAAAGIAGVAGCGTDHGQAKALTACHTFASANGGGLSASAKTAKLALAADWATRASKQSARWDVLQSSLAQFATASREATLPAATQSALRDARKVIDSSCAVAARGY
ncbi:MAG: hypothetical protein QOJ11_3286 [Frankiales bacterium]|nr:hypothetical protein [Frankiales bacterium]